MKSLDFAAMENVQGGLAGNITINLPVNGLLGLLGLGGVGVGVGLGVSYNLELPALPSVPSLPLGL